MSYLLVQADATQLPFADGAFDLVFGSPPYCDARTYGINAQRDCVEWVEWMLEVTTEAMRVCRGPVVWVAAGVTRQRNYWPACEGLMWEWWKRGGEYQLYRPCYWNRVGIPGSGGKDWFRADVEYVMCFKRPGALPWSDNTAMGHPPKWGVGGEMSYRVTDGTRRNQWGAKGGPRGMGARDKSGQPRPTDRPSHKLITRRDSSGECDHRRQIVTDPSKARKSIESTYYTTPVLANPGNLVRVKVGGGVMGNKLAHENEAPFPEKLAEYFIRSLCPVGGKVLDPFSGSGTTVAAAIANGRIGVGSDLRLNQCDLAGRRVASGMLAVPPKPKNPRKVKPQPMLFSLEVA